jgi:hypothetical protein
MATVPDSDVERKGVLEDRVSDAEKRAIPEDRVSGSADEKPGSSKVEDAAAAAPARGRHQPPAWIAALSVEERHELEKKLKRKIDVRLLPAVIIMYILNYIDRYVGALFMPQG